MPSLRICMSVGGLVTDDDMAAAPVVSTNRDRIAARRAVPNLAASVFRILVGLPNLILTSISPDLKQNFNFGTP